MSVKINIVSDLHIKNLLIKPDPEYCCVKVDKKKEAQLDLYKLNWDADYLVIAGDLAYNREDWGYAYRTLNDIKSRLKSHTKIIITFGNHDFWYNRKPYEPYDPTSWFSMGPQNLEHYNYYDVDVINQIVFIWSPLFSFVRDISIGDTVLGDFKNFYACFHEFYHYRTNLCFYSFATLWNMKYIENMNYLIEQYTRYSKQNYKIIFITHHAPNFECINDAIKDMPKMTIYQYWASNESVLTANLKPNVWIHGHSHEFFNQEINGVRYVRNPLRDYHMNIFKEAYNFTIEV